ncbi:MAG: hypothetical protein ACQEST_06440 [Bacteroidota bacterium]
MFFQESSIYRLTILFAVFIASLLIVQCTSSGQDNHDQDKDHEEVELAVVMSQLQTHTHKFALSVDAENHELASFYMHEMEESTETITEEVPTYEGHDIAGLMEQYLEPQMESTEEALEEKDWEKVRNQTIDLVDSCNSCHAASDHGFVKITSGFDKNPFNQDFSTSE